jgi:hypothetical protein
MQATRSALAIEGPKRPGGNSAPRHHQDRNLPDVLAGHKYAVNFVSRQKAKGEGECAGGQVSGPDALPELGDSVQRSV